MIWSNTLELALQKFDKLTTKYGQILSYARQGPDLRLFFKFFMFRILFCHHFTAFLMIRKRDCDRRRPFGSLHKSDRQQDFLLKSSSLGILVRTLKDAKVTVTFPNHK
jgi:hypothetical protein